MLNKPLPLATAAETAKVNIILRCNTQNNIANIFCGPMQLPNGKHESQ